MFFAMVTSRAANRIWNGGGADNNWLTAANWDAAIATNDALIFAGSTRLASVNNGTAGGNFNGITFSNNAGAFTVTGNPLALTAGITNNSAAIQNFNVNVALTGNRSIEVVSTGSLKMSGVISGTDFGLTKTGGGTLVLSGANTYSGGVTLNDGTLAISHVNALGSGTLTLAGGQITSGNFLFTNNLLVTGNATYQNTADNTDPGHPGSLSGSGTLTNLSTVSSFKWAGDISGFTGTFVDNSTANMIFRGTSAASRDGSNARWILNGTGFSVSPATSATFKLGELSGTGIVSGNASSSAIMTYEVGALNTSSTFSGTFQDGGGSPYGFCTVTKVGTGTLTLSGTNTFTGGLTISAGAVNLGSGNLLPNTGALIFNGGKFANSGYSDTLGALSIQSSSTIVLGTNATGTLTFASGSYTAGTLTISNWIGTAGVAGTANKIFITAAPGATFLTNLTFAGYQVGAIRLGTGELVPAGDLPTKLAITSVNGGSSPTAGLAFSVVVQSQDAGGTPRNVTTDTAVTLSRNTGSGTLGGTLSGTLTAGSSSVTFSGLTYTVAESGVVITATRTSGASLTAGNSSAFQVIQMLDGTIYLDHFSGATGALNNRTPDTATTSNNKWIAASGWTTDGTRANVTNATLCAFLPFVPAAGRIYRLSADIECVSTGAPDANWISLGFANGTNTDNAWYTMNNPVGWQLIRNSGNVVYAGQTFTGPGVTGALSTTVYPTNVMNYQVFLDTRPASASAWTFTFLINSNVVRTVSFGGSGPTISSVGIGMLASGGGRGYVKNFSLTGESAALPTKLAISSVNSGANPTVGAAFNVVVQAQDASNNPVSVVTNTAVTLSRNTGSGTLGGTLTGIIPAGSSSVTISGVTYNKAETGVSLTGTRTSGDSLTAGNSSAFAVRDPLAANLAIKGDLADYELYEEGVAGSPTNLTLRAGASSSTAPGGRNAIFIFALPAIGSSNQVCDATFNCNFASTSGTPVFNGDFWGLGFYPTNTAITNQYLESDTDTNPANVKLHDNIITPSTAPGFITSSNFSSYLQSFYAVNPNYSGGYYLFLRINPDVDSGGFIAGYNLSSADSTNPPKLNISTVTRVSAAVSLGNLTQLYAGTARFVTATTTPAGLTVNFTYNGAVNAPTNVGSYTVVGSINDTNYLGSATNTLLVSPARVTISSGLTANNKTYDGTTTASISSNNVVLAGVLVGDTGNVALSTNGYTAAFSSAPVSNGITVTVSGLTLTGSAAGNYTLTQPTTSANITKASTSPALASSLNPALPGSNVTFTAMINVVSPGGGTPTGNVIFKDGATVLGTNALNGAAVAILSTAALAHGSHTIAAGYAGDGNFLGSTNSLSQLINARPIAVSDVLPRNPRTGAKVRIVTLLANDTDPDGDALIVISVSATNTSGSTNVVMGNWILYQPPMGFTNADSFSYIIADSYGLQATGTVSIAILADNAPSQNVGRREILGNGSTRIYFNGISARTYTVQYAENFQAPNWQPLGTATADALGRFNFTDSPPTNSPPRFYRSTPQ